MQQTQEVNEQYTVVPKNVILKEMERLRGFPEVYHLHLAYLIKQITARIESGEGLSEFQIESIIKGAKKAKALCDDVISVTRKGKKPPAQPANYVTKTGRRFKNKPGRLAGSKPAQPDVAAQIQTLTAGMDELRGMFRQVLEKKGS